VNMGWRGSRRPFRAAPRVLVLTLLLGLLGAGAGAVWGELRGRMHQATAVILLNPTEGNPFAPDSAAGVNLVDLETEAQLVLSDEVARLVADRRGDDGTPSSQLSGVDAEVPPNTQLIEITVENKNSEEALDRAQAFAEVYLEYRQSRSETAAFDRGAAVKEQIRLQSDELQAQVQELDSATEGSPKALLLQQQIIELTDHLGQLRSEAADLDAAPVDPGQVVTPAYVKDAGPLGTGLVAAILGALVGAGLGLAWGLSRVRLAGWVRNPDDLDPVDVPVLAALGSRDPTPEDLGRLRAGVLSLDIRRPLVVVVTGLAGGTCSALPLASSLARANHEAVLVHTGTPEEEAVKVGLADLLRGQIDADEALEPALQHLTVLGPGTGTDDLDDLVMTPEMADLVEDLGKRGDLVILDAPDANSPRTLGLAQLADVVLLEVPRGRATLDQVEATLSLLGRPEQRSLALVVTAAPGRRAS
jgi:polysaccharide biosynthesis transport protein